MQPTSTARIRMSPNEEQPAVLKKTMRACQAACNVVSEFVCVVSETDDRALHAQFCGKLRSAFGLSSQMAQSF